MASSRLLIAAALTALVLGGCVSLRPLEEARAGLPAERFLDIDGHKIHTVTMGEGAPLLLVHGFGASTYSWRKVQPALAERFRTVAIDLYGFGLSARPRELERYTREGQVHLLVAVLDELGWERAHVAGHSYGGGLALNLAAWHPGRVASLVLIDTTPPDYADRRRDLGGLRPAAWFFVRGLGLRRPFLRRALERSFYDDDLVTEQLVAEYLERLKVEGAVRAYRGLTRPQRTAESERPAVRYEDIAQPTLVLWGEEDRLISLEGARRATERLGDGRLVSFPQCGHIPMEEKPRETASAMLEFLAATTAVQRER